MWGCQFFFNCIKRLSGFTVCQPQASHNTQALRFDEYFSFLINMRTKRFAKGIVRPFEPGTIPSGFPDSYFIKSIFW
jgi:hypothetical protein